MHLKFFSIKPKNKSHLTHSPRVWKTPDSFPNKLNKLLENYSRTAKVIMHLKTTYVLLKIIKCTNSHIKGRGIHFYTPFFLQSLCLLKENLKTKWGKNRGTYCESPDQPIWLTNKHSQIPVTHIPQTQPRYTVKPLTDSLTNQSWWEQETQAAPKVWCWPKASEYNHHPHSGGYFLAWCLCG